VKDTGVGLEAVRDDTRHRTPLPQLRLDPGSDLAAVHDLQVRRLHGMSVPKAVAEGTQPSGSRPKNETEMRHRGAGTPRNRSEPAGTPIRPATDDLALHRETSSISRNDEERARQDSNL
jgi:hypothetical protein